MKQREGKSDTNLPGNGKGLGRYRPLSFTQLIFFRDDQVGSIYGRRSGFGKGRASGHSDGEGQKR